MWVCLVPGTLGSLPAWKGQDALTCASSTESQTQIDGFRVQSADHCTTELHTTGVTGGPQPE